MVTRQPTTRTTLASKQRTPLHGQSSSPPSRFHNDINTRHHQTSIQQRHPPTLYRPPTSIASLIHQHIPPSTHNHNHPPTTTTTTTTPIQNAPRHRPHFLRWSLHRRQMPHLRRQSPKVSKNISHLYFRTLVPPIDISSSPIPSPPSSILKRLSLCFTPIFFVTSLPSTRSSTSASLPLLA